MIIWGIEVFRCLVFSVLDLLDYEKMLIFILLSNEVNFVWWVRGRVCWGMFVSEYLIFLNEGLFLVFFAGLRSVLIVYIISK